MSHGLAERTVFMNSLIPSRLVDKGPMTATICSSDSIVADHPSVGIRYEVGRRP